MLDHAPDARDDAPAGLDLTALDLADLRRSLAAGKDDASALLANMRGRLKAGRQMLRARFEGGGPAIETIHGLSALMDALIQGAVDHAERLHYPMSNPTTGERMALLAVGGYGRSELAPGSDIDLLFLYPYKRTPHLEQMTEFLLYKLWDLGLKVGHASRSVGECMKLAHDDLTVSTGLLESRHLWGNIDLAGELTRRYERQVIAGREAVFIEAKLAERHERHRRAGDSRFLLEPNVKEGKGGLRDLQTLVWLGKFLYRIRDIGDLVGHDVLTRQSLVAFQKAQQFLWTVRCHLHYLTGRPDDRLTVDVQPVIAERMGYRDRPRSLGVERFMKHYYLVARDVGMLTRVVCSALEEQHQRRPRLSWSNLGFMRRRVNGFVVQGGRVDIAEPSAFQEQPIRMLELFHLAQERELDVHPRALAAVSRNLKLVDQRLRDDPNANRLFLEMLCSRKDPATTLTRLNEAGVVGRFVPEFGRIVAQMQHNLYHVYTTDEHTIRAIDALHQIEQGNLAHELPLATQLVPKVLSRRELYVALFLHDIAKGRGGNHSGLGAEIALRLCPRLGLDAEETETVAWLVRHHLVMSRVAFKRDLEDPQTTGDFVAIVQSPERLRLLLVLTVCDIRAVGPSVWNGWKGQLLRELFNEAESAMASGDVTGRRAARIEEAKTALGCRLRDRPQPWPDEEIVDYLGSHDPRYWLGCAEEEHLRHAELIRAANRENALLAVDFRVDTFRARTELLIYTPDHPGLFMKIAGALALSGASIVDAHIFTTGEGRALDTLGFQDADKRSAIDDPARLERIRVNIDKALAGEIWFEKALAGKRGWPKRTDVFKVEPRVLVDNNASRTQTVIEVNGRDRPGLLFELAKALKNLGLQISSAHISTYGERVVDVFYVKDVFGLKITQRTKIQRVQKQLYDALEG